MAGKISAGMALAQKATLRFMKLGIPMHDINFAGMAKTYGTTANSIYRSAWYRELKAAQK